MDNYQVLLVKIDEFIRKYYLNKLTKGVIWFTAIALLSYLLITTAEYYSYFNITFRTILFYSFIIFIALSGWFLIGRFALKYYHLGKMISRENAAVIIGNHFPDVKDKLLNTLQLKHLTDSDPQQKLLINASINQKINALKPIPFTNAVNLGENKKYLRYAIAPVCAIIIIAFAAPSLLKDGTERMIKHNQYFERKAPFNFILLQKNLVVTQGDDLQLSWKLTGNEIPQDIYLIDGKNSYKLNKKSIISFNYLFRNLQKDKVFSLQADGFTSAPYRITVRNKPAVLQYAVALNYPKYLKKPVVQLNNPGDLQLPEGTNVKWHFKTEHADNILFKTGNEKLILKKSTASDNEFFLNKSFYNNSNYTFSAANSQVLDQDSSAYAITIIKDRYPQIMLNNKTDSINPKILYFVGKVSDDYGIQKLSFHYSITDTDRPEKKNKSFSKPVKLNGNTESDFFYYWDVNELDLQAGETASYYFEVADNDGVNGSKKTRSAEAVFKLASAEEIKTQLEEGSSSVKSKLSEAIKSTKSLQNQAKQISKDLLDKKTVNYDEKKQVEQLLSKQKQLQELIKNIQQENKKNLFQRKELTRQEESIIEKQKKIEELFNNVLDEKTKDLLKKLENLMQQNQKDLSREELANMQMDNKSLQKELDRILELYKQLEFEQKLNAATQDLEQLSKKQQELSKESEKTSAKKNQLQNKQQDLTNDFKELSKDLNELKQQNEQLEHPNNFNDQQKTSEEIKEEMNKASQSLDQNKKQQAAQQQQKAAAQMQKMADDLKKMQQESEEQENEVNQQDLRQILENLLKTSFDQEDLIKKFKTININDPQFLSLSQKQKVIKDNLKMVEDSLYSLSRRVPQIESAVNKEIQQINTNIDLSIRNLEERKIAELNKNQQFTMTAVNNLSLMLSEALEQLQNAMLNAKGGGKGKKQQSLSQLSKMQEQLNKNMQKAREQMQQQGIKPGQTGKNQMSEQMAKMAQQQQLIRESLQKINQELNKNGQQSLGNLEKIMKEMEQTETDLVNKRITREALMRQQEIQNRLLEAEKANREREQDKQRESKTGKDFAPDYNVILQEYQKMKQKDLELIKTIPPSLNSFYKLKVSTYFNRLNSK